MSVLARARKRLSPFGESEGVGICQRIWKGLMGLIELR